MLRSEYFAEQYNLILSIRVFVAKTNGISIDKVLGEDPNGVEDIGATENKAFGSPVGQLC